MGETPSCGPKNCSGHGACDDGNCSCLKGWEGDDCETPSVKNCPLNCSKHGECSSGKCACDYGYRGKGCQVMKCYHGALWESGIDGQNATEVPEDSVPKIGRNQTCLCNEGWEGIHCNTTSADRPSVMAGEATAKSKMAAAQAQLAKDAAG